MIVLALNSRPGFYKVAHILKLLNLLALIIAFHKLKISYNEL
jgi:hypothetical protein